MIRISIPRRSIPLALRLALRDLRSGLQGFRIFLACLMLGVAVIAAVQSVSSGILTGLKEDGRIFLGGDVSVRQIYTPPTGDPLAFLTASGRVSESAEMRGMARALDDQRSSLVEIKAVDGAYPLYGALELKDGGDLHAALARRDGLWGAVVEDSLLERLALKPGDRLRLGEAELVVRAVLLREPDKLAAGVFSLGPRLMIAREALPDTGLQQPGGIITWTEKIALPPGVQPEAWKAELNRRFPDAPWRVRDYTSASSQIESFIGRMTVFLTLVGLTALLVGGVGVSNAVHAHLDSRRRTIATLKCIGAPGALVFSTYLVQVLILAAGGIILGVMLGGVTPLLLDWLLENVLPVNARFGFYPKALGVAALFGLLTTLTFSLWPLGRARETPAGALFRDTITPSSGGRPRAACLAALLASAAALVALTILTAQDRYFAFLFVSGALVTLAVFRGAAWLVTSGASRARRPRRPGPRLALTNLHRPGNPTGSVVLSLGLGLTVLVAIALIEGNFSRRLNEVIPQNAPSFFFVDVQPDQFDSFKQTVLAVPGVTGFEAVPSLRGRIAQVNGVDAEKALKIPDSWILRNERGITYAAEPPLNGTIIAGSWWPADYQGPPLLSIHKDVADAFGIGPGDRITLIILGRPIEAEVANVRAADFSTMAINFTLVLSPGVLEAAPQTWIATVRAPEAQEPEVQRIVLKNFPTITTVRIKDALTVAASMLGNIGVAVRLTAAVTLIAGMLVLAGAVAAGHRRRVYDCVVLKVLGATRLDILGAFLMEYGLLGGITATISAIIGTVTAWAILTQRMHWPWVFLPSAVLWTAALGAATILVFGFLGTWRALGQPAAKLLRNE